MLGYFLAALPITLPTMDSTLTIARDAPRLSPSPWRFALYFYLKSRYTLAAIFLFEAAQAA